MSIHMPASSTQHSILYVAEACLSFATEEINRILTDRIYDFTAEPSDSKVPGIRDGQVSPRIAAEIRG